MPTVATVFGVTFGALRQANLSRDLQIFGHLKSWSANDYMVAVAGELGEAAGLLKKRRRGENIPTDHIAHELADVLIYLDLLAAKLGVDLEQAVIDKFNRVSVERLSSVTLRRQGDRYRPPGQEGLLLNGVDLIAKERLEQQYDAAHDDGHWQGDLAIAAAGLAVDTTAAQVTDDDGEDRGDPWGLVKKHHGNRVRQLMIAGALIAAEIDRLQRKEVHESFLRSGDFPDGLYHDFPNRQVVEFKGGHRCWTCAVEAYLLLGREGGGGTDADLRDLPSLGAQGPRKTGATPDLDILGRPFLGHVWRNGQCSNCMVLGHEAGAEHECPLRDDQNQAGEGAGEAQDAPGPGETTGYTPPVSPATEGRFRTKREEVRWRVKGLVTDLRREQRVFRGPGDPLTRVMASLVREAVALEQAIDELPAEEDPSDG